MGVFLNTRCVEGIRTTSHSYYQVIIINGEFFSFTRLVFHSTTKNFVILLIDLVAFSFTKTNVYTTLLNSVFLVSLYTNIIRKLKHYALLVNVAVN